MFTEFASEANAGQLYIDPELAIDAREATEKWLETLRDMHAKSLRILWSSGFSDLPSALQLAAKFDRKLTGDDGLQVRLRQFIEAGEHLSELLLRSIQKFHDEDAANAYLQQNNLPMELPNPSAG